MSFKRLMLASAGSSLPTNSRQGDGILNAVSRVAIAADANAVLTVEQISSGYVQFTGFTAGRTITPPTAALILAAFPDMDVGDTFQFMVSCVAAFAGTWQVATGLTLSGRATTPASSWSMITITKLTATTVELNVS